jgi:hypothetical protein
VRGSPLEGPGPLPTKIQAAQAAAVNPEEGERNRLMWAHLAGIKDQRQCGS